MFIARGAHAVVLLVVYGSVTSAAVRDAAKPPSETRVPQYVEAPADDRGAGRSMLAGGSISGVAPTSASGGAFITWTATGVGSNVDVWTRTLPAGAWALLGSFAAAAGTTNPTSYNFGTAGLQTEIWVGADGGQVVGSAINVAPGSPTIRAVGPATASGSSAITWTAQGVSGNVDVWVRTLPNGGWNLIGSFAAAAGTGGTYNFGPAATRTEIWIGGNGGSVVGRNVNLAPAPAALLSNGGLLAGGRTAGITMDPSTRNLYVAVDGGGCSGSFQLVRVSPSGVQAPIGAIPVYHCETVQMEWGPDGQIYTAESASPARVFRIDPSNGSLSTFNSNTGLSLGRHGLDFDSAGGLLLIREAVPNQIYRIPPGSGNVYLGSHASPASQHGDAGGLQPDGDIVIYPDCGSHGPVFELDADGHVPGTSYPMRDLSVTNVVGSDCGYSIGAVDPVNGDVFTTIANFGNGNLRINYTPGEIGSGATSGVVATGTAIMALVVGPASDGTINRSLYYVDNSTKALVERRITAFPSLAVAGPTASSGAQPITWTSTGLTTVDVWVRPLPGGAWNNLGPFPAGPGGTSPTTYDFGSAGQQTEIWLGGTGPGGGATALAVNTVPGVPTITAGTPPAGGPQPITWTSGGVSGTVEAWARPWPSGAWVQIGPAYPVGDGTTGANTYDFGGSGTQTEIWVGGNGGQVVGSLVFTTP